MTHHLTAWRVLAPLSALVLALSLSACSSQENTKAPLSGDPLTEGIENPDLPERPAKMDNYDEDGAIAAAEYFLRLSLYGFATGTWDEYNALSGPNCTFCQSYQAERENTRTPSTKRNMPEMKIQDATAWRYEENPHQIRVNLVAERYGYISTNSDGTITNQDGETTALAFLFEFKDDWQIVDVIPFEVEKYYEDIQQGQ